LDARSFSYWHTGLNDWTCAPGAYDVLAAASSRDVRLRTSVYVHNDAPAESPYAGLALASYENGLVHEIDDAAFEALLGCPLPPADYPVPRRLGLDANLEDARQSKFGRVFTKIVRMAIPVAEKFLGEALGDAETMIDSVFDMPIRTIAQWSGGFLDRRMAEALVSIFNEENYLQAVCELVKGAGRAVKRVIGK